MAEEVYPGPLHLEVTRRGRFRYFFYDKHHTPNNTADAQWSESLTQAEEFAIFDQADFEQIRVANGDLFGIWKTSTGEIRALGTEQQEIAKFPVTKSLRAWHGYPLWPLSSSGANERNRLPIPKAALRLMEARGWISEVQRRKLEKGKYIS